MRWHHLQKESIPAALVEFLEDPRCTAATAAVIHEILDTAAQERRRPTIPLSLRRAAFVTEEEKAKFRGKKHAQNFALVMHRSMEIWLPDGTHQVIRAGEMYESDDESINQPCHHRDLATGKIELGRQSLHSACVATQRFLGATILLRERDAYRAEDVGDHMLDICTALGKPLRWRLEKGIWDSNFIHGIPLDSPEAERRGLGGKRFQGKRWGALPFEIINVPESRGKGGVESAFNFQQTLMAHKSLDIGRFRGEFEEAMRLYLKAKNGDEKAALKFWTIAEAMEGLLTAIQQFNQTPKQRLYSHGRELVVPDELWMQDRPTEEIPRPLTAEDIRLFSPIKKLATVRKSAISLTCDHYTNQFNFIVNEGNFPGYLGHGHRVAVAFHPGHPERGCHVYNADVGPANRENWNFGQFLGTARLQEMVPQIDLRTNRDRSPKAITNSRMSAEFRAIAQPGRGLAAMARSTKRDGAGSSYNLESNMPQAPEPLPEAPTPRAAAIPAAPHRYPVPDLAEVRHRAEAVLWDD